MNKKICHNKNVKEFNYFVYVIKFRTMYQEHFLHIHIYFLAQFIEESNIFFIFNVYYIKVKGRSVFLIIFDLVDCNAM